MTAHHTHAPDQVDNLSTRLRLLPHPPEIVEAAQWLSDTRVPPRLIVPHLAERFGLDSSKACAAIYLAGEMRLLRRVFG
ncbi:hypothetical protein ASG50_30115 [Rhizobium sp. Leaf386]|nr:hypothetical protein ASG50_30115 [Rhizobium sp. Leaf386]